MVEFANRMLNAAVGLLSVATVAGALLRDPRRRDLVRWSWGVFAWVASNGIVGAFVVWLHLSPVSVIGHFALALGAIWNALVLLQRAGEDDGAGERRRVDATGRFVTATKVLLVAAGAVLATGTLVTGSGPHAGDERADRLALEVGTVARVHGLTMIAFLAVTLALIRMAHRGEAGPRVAQRLHELLVVLVGQAAIGYWQYLTGIPALLVAFHVWAPRWSGSRCCGCGCRSTFRCPRPPSRSGRIVLARGRPCGRRARCHSARPGGDALTSGVRE